LGGKTTELASYKILATVWRRRRGGEDKQTNKHQELQFHSSTQRQKHIDYLQSVRKSMVRFYTGYPNTDEVKEKGKQQQQQQQQQKSKKTNPV